MNKQQLLSLDLGRPGETVGICVLDVHDVTDFRLALRYCDRLPAGTSFPEIIRETCRLKAQLDAEAQLVLVITGVGDPVVSAFHEAGLYPTPLVFCGGDTVEARPGGGYRVPKRDAVVKLLTLFQQGRLQLAEWLNHRATLVRELAEVRLEVKERMAEELAYRVGRSDDLVYSLAAAAWQARRSPGVILAW